MATKWTPEMKAERSPQQKLLWAQKKADKEAAESCCCQTFRLQRLKQRRRKWRWSVAGASCPRLILPHRLRICFRVASRSWKCIRFRRRSQRPHTGSSVVLVSRYRKRARNARAEATGYRLVERTEIGLNDAQVSPGNNDLGVHVRRWVDSGGVNGTHRSLPT
jgi:hypothetical protein